MMMNNLYSFWKKQNRQSILLITFSVLTFITIILFSLTDPEIKQVPHKAKKVADFEFTNVKITYLEDGVSNWELKAKNASIYKNKNITHLTSVDGMVFHQEKTVVLFSSPTANFDLFSSKIILKEALATINNKTRKIQVLANTLSWLPLEKSLIGQEKTAIKTRGLSLFGDYFKVDVPFKKLIISDHGKAIIKNNEI